MMPEPTIILLGGGFSDDEFTDLDTFFLESCKAERPRVCFIPTASGDSPDYIQRYYTAFDARNCEPTHLELFRRTVGDFDEFFENQDALYVGGGNTANLLSLWRLHGLDEAIVRAYKRGVVLGGISAGAACWFDACLTDSYGRLSPLADGLGLIQGSFCPHHNSEPERPRLYKQAVATSLLPGGVALDDGAAAQYVNGALERVYRSDPQAELHHVERNHG